MASKKDKIDLIKKLKEIQKVQKSQQKKKKSNKSNPFIALFLVAILVAVIYSFVNTNSKEIINDKL
jgi:anaerobic C4-dicarboxylate transporter